MTNDDITEKNYLENLYNKCNRDMTEKYSMFDTGIELGLEKNEAGALAEDLMVKGLVELKTLAGEVSITLEGLELLGLAPATDSTGTDPDTQGQKFSKQLILDAQDQSLVQQLLEETKQALSSRSLDYELIQEIVIDLKTIEVQLLSSKPKSVIILAGFSSIRDALHKAELKQVADTISGCL